MRISDWSSDVCSSDLVDQLLRRPRPMDVVALEQGVVDLIRAGQRGGVRRGRLGADGRAADLLDDDRLSPQEGEFQRRLQLRAVLAAFEIAGDDGGLLVLGEEGDAVGDIDVALVAGGDPVAEAQALFAAEHEAVRAESAALADDADASRLWLAMADARREGAVDMGAGAEVAEAVRAEEPHPAGLRRLDRKSTRLNSRH